MPQPDDRRWLHDRRPLTELLGIAATIVAVWLAVAVFNSSNFFYTASTTTLPANWMDTLCFQLASATVWAAFTPIVVATAERLLFRRGRIIRDIVVLLAAVPLLAVFRGAFGGILLEIAQGDLPTLSFAWLSIVKRLHVNVFFVAVIVGVTKLMDVYRDADIAERKAVALQAEVADAEAEHLRAQTQPSFLFGTLQAIRARVRSDPGAADRMLVLLGDLLRRRLDQRAGEAVTLEGELVSMERYFELLGIRSSTPMQVQLDLEEDVLNASVRPFTLQTLLETVVGDASPACLYMRGRALGGTLALEARALPVAAPPTVIAAAQERLEQWFGPDCHSDVRKDGSTMIARVGLRLCYLEGAAE